MEIQSSKINNGMSQALSTEFLLETQPCFLVSATFTIDYLLPNLNYLFDFIGLPFKTAVAPYNQIFQQLLDPSSESAQNHSGINLFVLRLEDFARDYSGTMNIVEHVQKISLELVDSINKFLKNTNSQAIFVILPCSPGVSGELKLKLNNASASLMDKIRNLPGLALISFDDLSKAAFDTDSGYDEISDSLAHVPFNEEAFAALALAISRKTHSIRVPARKVLVLDCDNTIWRGVVGEDGVDGISLPSACLQIQQFAVDAQAQGTLICLASKNAEQDVLDVFEHRSDMPLKMEHIVAHRINWESKPRNLKSLADELNLSLDAFVFLDDNPVECAQMRSELPMVMTLQIPSDAEVLSFLDHLWAFDKLAVTEEDTKRTQMYRENSARQQLESTVSDIGEFLASLELKIDIDQPADDEWSRIAQLTQRTNQFNFTTRRRNEQDIRALANTEGMSVLRVKVCDRFGDYGLVGLAISRMDDDALTVDTLLLSCRVLGRGVEHALLRRLGEIAASAGRARIDLPYILTAKNEPARAFADNVAFTFKFIDEASVCYHIPVDDACKLTHLPGGDPAAVLEASRSESKKKPATPTSANPAIHCSERYEKLASNLTSGTAVLTALQMGNRRIRELETIAAVPETSLERELLELWQDLLGMQGLGVEDDYFAVGGTSLLAARLFSEIARRYKTRLRMTAILDAPTVRSLAHYIQANRSLGAEILVDLKPGSKRTIFLVHDGDGETFLYRNLAARMPDELAVVGIEPYSVPGVPMAHTSIEEMAAFYIQAIRNRQPQGPYLLGGMCAGGLIAYAIGVQLTSAGDKVDLVAIMDAATPQAEKRLGITTQARTKRLSALFSSANETTFNILHRCTYISTLLIKKIFNALRWELSSRLYRIFTRLRFQTLKHILLHDKAWPKYLPELSVRDIYTSVEANCRLESDDSLEVLLVRATFGEGDDTPYRNIYSDDTFGWRNLASDLDVVDVDGGHSSMLQEPYVKSLASALIKYARI